MPEDGVPLRQHVITSRAPVYHHDLLAVSAVCGTQSVRQTYLANIREPTTSSRRLVHEKLVYNHRVIGEVRRFLVHGIPRKIPR